MKSKLLTFIVCLISCLDLSLAETAEYAPPGYVSGCKMIYVTSNSITITSGKLSDSTDSQYMVLSTNVLVDITKSGDNGLDTGTETSNLWYVVFVAVATNQSIVGVLSTNMSGPTGYTDFRVIGCVRNDSNKDIRPFIQRWNGSTRLFEWDAAIADTRPLQNGNSTTNFVLDLSDYVPPTATSAKLQVSFESGASGSASDSLRLKADGINNSTLRLSAGVVSTDKIITNGDISTSMSQKITYKVDNSNNKATIVVKGYYDEL